MIDPHLEDTKVSPHVTPRLGFLGVGMIGLHRLKAIAASGVARIVAIADPLQENLLRAQEVAPNTTLHTSMDELWEHPLDGIVIATPSALHMEQCLTALNRGVAVFCQNPLGRNVNETRQVIEAAQAADKLVGVDHSYRLTSAAQALYPLITGGDLGDIFAVNLVYHNAYGPDKPWAYDPALAGGGCIIDQGIHLLDLALWLLNFPAAHHVTSRLYSKGVALTDRKAAVEDYAISRLDLTSGASIQLTCSWHLAAGCDCVIEASFYGSKGGVTFRNLNGSFYDLTAERFTGTKRETLTEPQDDWGGRAAVTWVNQLARGAGFLGESLPLIDVAQAIDAIYAGAA